MKKSTAQKLLKFSEKEYDTYAREFSDCRPFFWRELEPLRKYAREGQSILDVGCGNGRLLNLIEGKRVNYTGVDSSKTLIELAQRYRGHKGKFLHVNALHLPFPDTIFDTTFAIAVLHHVPSKEFRTRFMIEAYRTLKPRGTLVLTVWNIWQWRFFLVHLKHILKKLSGTSGLDFGDTILSFGQMKRQRYVHAFTKKSLRRLLEKNGFSVSSIEEAKRKSGYANLVAIAKKR